MDDFLNFLGILLYSLVCAVGGIMCGILLKLGVESLGAGYIIQFIVTCFGFLVGAIGTALAYLRIFS